MPHEGTFYFQDGRRFIGKYNRDDFTKRSGILINAGQDIEFGDRYVGEFVKISNDELFVKNGKGEQWKYLGFRVEEKYEQIIQLEDSSLSNEPRWKIVEQQKHSFPTDETLRRYEKIHNLRTETREIDVDLRDVHIWSIRDEVWDHGKQISP